MDLTILETHVETVLAVGGHVDECIICGKLPTVADKVWVMIERVITEYACSKRCAQLRADQHFLLGNVTITWKRM